MKTAVLVSTYGTLEFNAKSGFVVKMNLDEAFGPRPYKIDVDEWRLRYPDEDMAVPESVHDILDFGYWWRKGKQVGYEAPCEDWRKDREARIREERREARS